MLEEKTETSRQKADALSAVALQTTEGGVSSNSSGLVWKKCSREDFAFDCVFSLARNFEVGDAVQQQMKAGHGQDIKVTAYQVDGVKGFDGMVLKYEWEAKRGVIDKMLRAGMSSLLEQYQGAEPLPPTEPVQIEGFEEARMAVGTIRSPQKTVRLYGFGARSKEAVYVFQLFDNENKLKDEDFDRMARSFSLEPH